MPPKKFLTSMFAVALAAMVVVGLCVLSPQVGAVGIVVAVLAGVFWIGSLLLRVCRSDARHPLCDDAVVLAEHADVPVREFGYPTWPPLAVVLIVILMLGMSVFFLATAPHAGGVLVALLLGVPGVWLAWFAWRACRLRVRISPRGIEADTHLGCTFLRWQDVTGIRRQDVVLKRQRVASNYVLCSPSRAKISLNERLIALDELLSIVSEHAHFATDAARQVNVDMRR